METILTVDGYAKHFLLHEQNKLIPSAAGVSLRVRAGRLTALTAPTGAGKSSVLKGIYRTYIPCAGRLLYRSAAGAEIDLALATEHQILELRRSEIGFVTQFLHCLPRRAAQDVVAEPLLARGWKREAARAEAQRLLARLRVPPRLWNVPPATFSGGEKQRVNLARGLIARPRLLLLDEPTASLDAGTVEDATALIAELKAEGVGILAVFHDPALVKRMADDIVTLAPPVVAPDLIREAVS